MSELDNDLDILDLSTEGQDDEVGQGFYLPFMNNQKSTRSVTITLPEYPETTGGGIVVELVQVYEGQDVTTTVTAKGNPQCAEEYIAMLDIIKQFS